jgi:hypothetical protein
MIWWFRSPYGPIQGSLYIRSHSPPSKSGEWQIALCKAPSSIATTKTSPKLLGLIKVFVESNLVDLTGVQSNLVELSLVYSSQVELS